MERNFLEMINNLKYNILYFYYRIEIFLLTWFYIIFNTKTREQWLQGKDILRVRLRKQVPGPMVHALADVTGIPKEEFYR